MESAGSPSANTLSADWTESDQIGSDLNGSVDQTGTTLTGYLLVLVSGNQAIVIWQRVRQREEPLGLLERVLPMRKVGWAAVRDAVTAKGVRQLILTSHLDLQVVLDCDGDPQPHVADFRRQRLPLVRDVGKCSVESQLVRHVHDVSWKEDQRRAGRTSDVLTDRPDGGEPFVVDHSPAEIPVAHRRPRDRLS